MKPQLPKQIKVGPMRFNVTKAAAEYYKFSRENKEHEVFGYMDYRTGRILLDPDQTEDCMQDTVLHELLHIVWSQAGATENFEEDNIEERVITTLTAGLLAALQNNPKLVEYLTGRTYGS